MAVSPSLVATFRSGRFAGRPRPATGPSAAGSAARSTPNYYKLRMPTWAANSTPTALTAAEAAAVAALKANP